MPATIPAVPVHERWFENPTAGSDWGFYFSLLPLALTAAVLVVAVAWRLVACGCTVPSSAYSGRCPA